MSDGVSAFTTDLLIVDDEIGLRRGVERIVQTEGFTVVGAASAREALALIADGVRPKVIFSDLMMPHMNGAELLERLRQLPELAKTPIYMMSGGFAPVSAADGHIEKPFDLVAMVEILARHCR